MATHVRLVGGAQSAQSYSGTIEIKDERAKPNVGYGTICDDYFDDREAIVICKMLGFNYGIARIGAHFGRGTGNIVMDDLKCHGEELSITKCKRRSDGRHNCDHGEDAGVECSHEIIRGGH